MATDKTVKPADLTFQAPRISFDCTPLETIELVPGQTLNRTGDTTGGTSLIEGYPCAPWAEEGPEDIYRLEVDSPLELWAGLSDFEDQDFDLFLLNGCDTDSCMAAANLELGAELDVGTYYLIVDGAGSSNPAEGPYTLDLITRHIGVPPEICAGGFDHEATCGTGPHSFVDNTLEAENTIQTYGCSPIIERGGEIWVAVTVEDNTEITARTTELAGAFDAALWLFAACGPEAECLAFSDEEVGGGNETIVWANLSGETVTVYLALDSYRRPSGAEQAQVEFEITCRGPVPNEKSSWGSLRSRFR